MKQLPIGYLILSVVLAALCFSAVGGSEMTSQSDAVGELAGIRVALEKLTTQVDTMRRSSDAELVLRQIQLHEQRLAPLEARLASRQREDLDTQAFIVSARERLAQAERRIAEAGREGREPSDELRKERDLIAQALKGDKSRAESLRAQIIILENQIAEARRKVVILEESFIDLVDEN